MYFFFFAYGVSMFAHCKVHKKNKNVGLTLVSSPLSSVQQTKFQGLDIIDSIDGVFSSLFLCKEQAFYPCLFSL